MAETDTLDKPKPDDATDKPADPPKPAPAAAPKAPVSMGYGDLSAMASEILEQGRQTEKRVAARGQRAEGLVTDMKSISDQARLREPPAAPDLPPPPQLQQRDPAEMFGATAVALAGLLSAFTRAPLTSALNAAGGAMKAMKDSDWATYEHDLQAWKLNSDYAFKRADYENGRYKMLIENDKLGIDALQGALTAELAGNRDDIGMQKLRTEGLGAFEKLVYDRLHLAQEAANHRDSINVQRAQIEASMPPDNRIMLQYWRENPGSTAEKAAAFYRERVHPLYSGKSGSAATQLQSKIFTDWMTDETERRGAAPGVDEQIEKLREINATSATFQAAGVRASAATRIAGDKLALQRELGERALDLKDEQLQQTQWWQQQRVRLMEQGLDQKEADAALRERIATMRNDTTQRGQDLQGARAADRLTLQRELGERALDQKDEIIAQTGWWREQRAALLERGLDIKEADAVLKERIAKMRDATTQRGQDLSAENLSREQARAVAELVQGGMPRVDAIKKVREAAGAGASGGPEGQLMSQWRTEFQAKNQRPPTAAEATAQLQKVREGSRPPSAAAVRDEQKAAEVAAVLDLGDNTAAMIRSTTAALGIAGKVGRPSETLGNLLKATDDTNRRQIESNITTLRNTMLRLMNDRSIMTRADHADAEKMIRGLEAGSTIENTIRSIETMQGLIARKYKGALERHGFLDNKDTAPRTAGDQPPQRGYEVDQIIERGGKKYRVTGGDLANDPDVVEVK